jgi:hypothetical protein
MVARSGEPICGEAHRRAVLRGIKEAFDRLFPFRCEHCGMWLMNDEVHSYETEEGTVTVCYQCLVKHELGEE